MAQVIKNQKGDVQDKNENCSTSSDDKLEAGLKVSGDGGDTWNWDDDPNNPYNWPSRLKVQQVLMIASAALTTYVDLSR
jgi:hypothetical protein